MTNLGTQSTCTRYIFRISYWHKWRWSYMYDINKLSLSQSDLLLEGHADGKMTTTNAVVCLKEDK